MNIFIGTRSQLEVVVVTQHKAGHISLESSGDGHGQSFVNVAHLHGFTILLHIDVGSGTGIEGTACKGHIGNRHQLGLKLGVVSFDVGNGGHDRSHGTGVDGGSGEISGRNQLNQTIVQCTGTVNTSGDDITFRISTGNDTGTLIVNQQTAGRILNVDVCTILKHEGHIARDFVNGAVGCSVGSLESGNAGHFNREGIGCGSHGAAVSAFNSDSLDRGSSVHSDRSAVDRRLGCRSRAIQCVVDNGICGFTGDSHILCRVIESGPRSECRGGHCHTCGSISNLDGFDVEGF